MSLSVVLLAAGQGSRMKSENPKVLHTLCGRPMLHHILENAQGFSDDVQVVLYHHADAIKNFLDGAFPAVKPVMQDHENYPGTGGAIMAAAPEGGKVLVLNGDMPLITAEAIEAFMKVEADVAVAAFRTPAPQGYGRVITDGDRVVKIVEEKDATPMEKETTLVNAGIYLFSKAFLDANLPKLSNDNAQKEYYITQLVELAVNAGTAVAPVVMDEESCMGVNSKVELARAEEVMLTRLREKWMKAGVIIRQPHTVYLDASVEFEGECEVESGAVIKGNSRIVRSVVKAHSVIEDGTLIDSDVGPMARIRPGSVLEGTHIGNFVEAKKARLTGVKAGHLSYLGDCEMAEGTNVGAGTITCNYDGKAKYKTTVGKNVFIGSDTQLVAPVTVADNVLIAAGTTVTKDVEEGSLAISRTPQKNVAGFFKKFFGTK